METVLLEERKEISQPRLHFSYRLLKEIDEECLLYRNSETGGYLFGLMTKKDAWVIGSFTPPSREIFRSEVFLSAGGNVCADFYDWQMANWRNRFSCFLERFGMKYNSDCSRHRLRLLGFWHKHPSAINRFSPLDEKQVKENLQLGMTDYLFPIVVLTVDPPSLQVSPENFRHKISDRHFLDVTFYFRTNGSDRTYRLSFERDNIIHREYDMTLAPTPWYVSCPELLEKESKRLSQFGYNASLVIAEPANKESLCRIIVEVKHPSTDDPFYIETSLNYHKDGVVQLLVGSQKIGMKIKPSSKQSGIADLIKPIIDYQLEQLNYLRKKKNET